MNETLFNTENPLLGIGQKMSEEFYGMAQTKANALIKNAGAQIESVLVGQDEMSKYKAALMRSGTYAAAIEGAAIVASGGAAAWPTIGKAFLMALETGWNLGEAYMQEEPELPGIDSGAFVLIHNGQVPTTRGADGRSHRSRMHSDATFGNTFNDFAQFGQRPDFEGLPEPEVRTKFLGVFGKGTDKIEMKADVSYGFYIEMVDAHICKVYNFELARPQDVQRRNVQQVDPAKQQSLAKSSVNEIRKAYFRTEQALIVNNRLSIDPGTQVYEKNDPETPYTVVAVKGDHVVITPEGGGNEKYIAIEHLRAGRQEHTTQYNYSEAAVNVATPQGRVPIRTGCYMWFKIRPGFKAKYGEKIQSSVEIALLRDINAHAFQIVYAYDGAVVDCTSKVFYSNVIPFSDDDRALITGYPAFLKLKDKVMDDSLGNWRGYAPGELSGTLAAICLGHLEGKQGWIENIRERVQATGEFQTRGKQHIRRSKTTVVGESKPMVSKPVQLDTIEELAAMGLDAPKPVDVMYGEPGGYEPVPVAPTNSTNGALGILAGAVLVGGYLMS